MTTNMFAQIQEGFAAALLDSDRPVPPALASHMGGGSPFKRFSVYRNNVVVGLVDALCERFPVVQKLVGEEFFRAMANIFVRLHPPRSVILAHYGDDFADFIAGFSPAAELCYLPDVARLEAARTRAYHAADARPIEPTALKSLAPEMLAGIGVILHPSAQIVRSSYSIVTIWAMNSGEAALAPIDADRPEDALVLRPHLDVIVRKLPAGAAAFLLALASGLPLGEAVDDTVARHPEFDLVANMAGLIGSGVMTGFSLERDPPKWEPVRREIARKTKDTGARSAEVGTGSA